MPTRYISYRFLLMLNTKMSKNNKLFKKITFLILLLQKLHFNLSLRMIYDVCKTSIFALF